jgi:hypothetical protein
MKKLLELLSELKSAGLIADYALGGATALVYYWEPVQTQDVDIFIVLSDKSNELVNLAPIYDFLTGKGVTTDKEYLHIDGTPVQFLVPYNQLVEEAVKSAKEVSFLGQSVRIPPLEYLMAIMLQTNRPKDRARLHDIFEEKGLFNLDALRALSERFGLAARLEALV